MYIGNAISVWALIFLAGVGALGVPQVNPGVSLSYEFYNQKVSWEVETVCQALATHDRMSLFTPCFITRDEEASDIYTGTTFETKETWFPGWHFSPIFSLRCPAPHALPHDMMAEQKQNLPKRSAF